MTQITLNAEYLNVPSGALMKGSHRVAYNLRKVSRAETGLERYWSNIVKKSSQIRRIFLTKNSVTAESSTSYAITCGERGIRTPGASQHGSFQDYCNRPLYHLSGVIQSAKLQLFLHIQGIKSRKNVIPTPDDLLFCVVSGPKSPCAYASISV